MVSGIRDDNDVGDAHPSSSRCWLPLVYSSMAILMDQGQQQVHEEGGATVSPPSTTCASAEAMSTSTGRQRLIGNASLFPCHSWVLAAVVCELLLLDGTLDAATLTVLPRQVRLVVRRVGSRGTGLMLSAAKDDDDKDRGAAGQGDPGASAATSSISRHEWHMMSREARARYSLRNEDTEPASAGDRGGASEEVAGRPPKVLVAPRRKRKRRTANAETVMSAPRNGSTLVGADGNVDETSKVVPAAERVVASVLGRVADYAASHPLAFPKGDPFPSESAMTATAAPAAPAIRKVSDADANGTRRIDSDFATHSSSPPISASSYPMSVGSRDIARHWEQCRALMHRRQEPTCISAIVSNLPPLVEASIVTEEVLRRHAHEMVRILLETFETQHLRRFFGYRKPSTRRKAAGEGRGGGDAPCDSDGPREGFVRLIMDFVFDASHAMFAWQDFEVTGPPGNLPAALENDLATSDQKDRAIAAALFDDRALRQIGGVENGSIVRLALALGRNQRSRKSWADLLTSSEGKHLVEHHLGTPEKLYAVGEKRRGRRMRRNRASSPSPVPVDCSAIIPFPSAPSNASSLATNASVEGGTRSRASSIASLDDDVISPALDSTHGRIQVRLSRKGSRWGVKLCKIGDMCVVESCGTLNSTQPGFLRQGDNILFVANPQGDSAYSPAYKSLSSCQHWFRDIVNLFSDSDEVILVVQRVESICVASMSSSSSVGS